ncbi:RluA family pseudouridine synthase [Thomasclavelia sp.]|uniref:RluA family pseudouridine synthase n=1 Tax=Thomasclavelia sp. TaxID=3025757 RepID=UPI0025D47CF0|nr:RluA family pseudouridine synthase [Thomasclavelia sp.]
MNRFKVSQPGSLFDFLLTKYNKKKVKNLLKYKCVKVNDQTISQFDYQLNIGDLVFVDSNQDNQLEILYEDNQLIVINKPSGLLSIAGGLEKEKTAYHYVSEYLKKKNKKARVFIVHRLDRETSGVLMFAKNEEIKNLLQNNWNKLVYKRGYKAIVEGRLTKKQGTIKSYLQESKTQQVYIATKGKLAITHYQVIKETKNNSLLSINLDTGRKNQIRVQLQSIGHSIIGDKKYGATTNPIKRLGLHADIFGFIHPQTKRKMEFEAKLPDEFISLFGSVK